MAGLGKAVGFGFLVWLIAFVAAVVISPIRESWRALFESVMPVVVTAAAVVFAVIYFRKVQRAFVKEGIILGCLWYVICMVIDLPLMLSGPMKMGVVEYMADVGLAYLVIPAVTLGIGLAQAQGGKRAEPSE